MLNKKLKNPKNKTQVKAASGSNIYLTKSTCFNFGINPLKVKHVSFDLYPDTSRLSSHMRFVTLLSYDLEPDIIITTPQNISTLDDVAPHMFKLEHIIRSD